MERLLGPAVSPAATTSCRCRRRTFAPSTARAGSTSSALTSIPLLLPLEATTAPTTAVDLSDLSQCKYCLKDFESNFTLQKHMDDSHYKSNSQFVCRICNIAFPQALHLVSHMQKIHVRAELPYACQVCGFRTSSHREAVDHFIEQHDRTDKLQCPRCLKIFCLFSDNLVQTCLIFEYAQKTFDSMDLLH